MAAPIVNPGANTVRGKKGNKSHFPVKNTIISPFSVEWPALSKEDGTLILEKIKSTFTLHAASLAKLPSKGRRQVVSDVTKKRRAVLRSQLALGVNEVTRSLEQGELRLALICRSAKPALMTNHLLSLSATRHTAVLNLYGLSDTLAPILKLKVILAIGFKKTAADDPTAFDDLVNSITAVTPPIHVPWLQYKELTIDELREVVTNVVLAVRTGKTSDAKQKGKKKGQKKGERSSAVQRTDHVQTGISSGSKGQVQINPDSGANVKVLEQAQKAIHLKSGEAHEQGERMEGDSFKQSPIPAEIIDEMQSQSASDTAKSTSVESTDQISASSKKRKLSASPQVTTNKKAKMVLKPEYKPVTVLPVKIIPKSMKNKKQLKKKRKKNKKKGK